MQRLEYQIAIATDPSLEFRKWDHKGTVLGYTSRDAAFMSRNGRNKTGDIVKVHGNIGPGLFYEFSDGEFVSVH